MPRYDLPTLLFMTDADIIDQQVLDRLKQWGGEKLLTQMVRLFLENSPTRMEQIRAGVRAGSVKDAERGSHSLKSSAANIGAVSLQNLAAAMERAAMEEDLAAVEDMLPELERAYGEARTALESLQPDGS